MSHSEPMASSSSTSSRSSPIHSSDRKEVVIKINGKESTKETQPSSSQPQQHSNLNTSKHVAANDQVLKEKAIATGNANRNKDFEFVKESASTLSRRSSLSAMGKSTNNGQILQKGGNVSFKENVAAERVRLPSNIGGRGGGNGGEHEEVLLCSSNSTFRQNSILLRTKSKSRLMDSLEEDQHQPRRAFNRSSSKIRDTDDDPFLEEDFPVDYKKMELSLLTMLELLILILLIVGLICTLTIQVVKKKSIYELELWKWEVMALVLICGRLVSELGVKIVVFFIERSFLLRKRVCYFVYGLRKPVQNCIWLSLVLIAWVCIFDNKVNELTNQKVLPYVTKIWVCLLVGTFIWLLKTLLVKVLAMSFHVNTFFDKIHESLFNQYVIETLSGPPLFENQEDQEGEENIKAQNNQTESYSTGYQKIQDTGPGKMIGNTPRKSSVLTRANSSKKEEEEQGMTIDQLHRLNQKNVSAWKMKRLIHHVKRGMPSTFDEQLRESIRQDESAVQITSEKQAKVVATKLFNQVARREPGHICLDDLMDYLREDEALKTMSLFEGATNNKRISEETFMDWVVNVFRERRALALSLDDTKTAVKKLHQMLNFVVAIIILVIWLLILKVTTRNFFIFLSSQLLLVVFVFGNTCKTTFEAIIFVFIMHPFDVGDRVEVDGVLMLVEEMNILTTVFLRYDNHKIIYPNSVLSTKPILNYNRSPHTRDAVDFSIHISTPVDKIDKMKQEITRYVNDKSDHWHQDPTVFIRNIDDMNRIKWSVWPIHTMNFQNIGQRWLRRALLIEEMIKIFQKLGIEYRMLPYDVNVRNMPPLTSSRLPSNWTASA